MKRPAAILLLGASAMVGMLLMPRPALAIGSGRRSRRVAIADSLGSAPLFSLGQMRPGAQVARCVWLTNRASRKVSISLFASVRAGGLGSSLLLSVLRGSQSGRARRGSCAGFHAERGRPLYAGPLTAMPRSRDRALRDSPALRPGARRAYRFTVTLLDHATAAGKSAAASFVFLARDVRALSQSASVRLAASFAAERHFPPQNPTSPTAQNLTPPTVTGAAALGQRLLAAPGTWSQRPVGVHVCLGALRCQWHGVCFDPRGRRIRLSATGRRCRPYAASARERGQRGRGLERCRERTVGGRPSLRSVRAAGGRRSRGRADPERHHERLAGE